MQYRKYLWIAAFVLLTASQAMAVQIWAGLTQTFTKADFADWTLEVNQDRVTENVWLTRADTQGLFNIAVESEFDDGTYLSPLDTEWAMGDATNWENLTFTTWDDWHGGAPPSVIGQDAVVHLISDDTYMDIRMLSWTQGGAGGGFSYIRGVPEPASLALLALGGLLLVRRR